MQVSASGNQAISARSAWEAETDPRHCSGINLIKIASSVTAIFSSFLIGTVCFPHHKMSLVMATVTCLLGSTYSAALPVERTPKIVLITAASVAAVQLNYWLLNDRKVRTIADIIAIAIILTHAALCTRDKSQSFISSIKALLCE